jgi:hypothetical protein
MTALVIELVLVLVLVVEFPDGHSVVGAAVAEGHTVVVGGI